VHYLRLGREELANGGEHSHAAMRTLFDRRARTCPHGMVVTCLQMGALGSSADVYGRLVRRAEDYLEELVVMTLKCRV
jgi:hypothetical protein